VRLQLATWPDIERYLARSRGIIIPIGSTEQHGPNGLIGTDAICPETIATGFGTRDEVLIAPTLSIGMAQHHLAFPGSITLRPSTLMAVIDDVTASLLRQGFRSLYFYNGHGGNVATVHAAFAEIYARRSLVQGEAADFHLRITNWYEGRRVRALSRTLFGDAEGSHATPSEVSLSWHAWPEAQQEVAMSPQRAPSGAFRDAEDYRRRFADGRIGSEPALASREAGSRLCEAGIEDLRESYRAFMAA
jgi:creatinine amidohydrolase